MENITGLIIYLVSIYTKNRRWFSGKELVLYKVLFFFLFTECSGMYQCPSERKRWKKKESSVSSLECRTWYRSVFDGLSVTSLLPRVFVAVITGPYSWYLVKRKRLLWRYDDDLTLKRKGSCCNRGEPGAITEKKKDWQQQCYFSW